MSYETNLNSSNLFSHHGAIEEQIVILPTATNNNIILSREDLIENELMERVIQLGLGRQFEDRLQERRAEISAQKDSIIETLTKKSIEKDARHAEDVAQIARLNEIINNQQAENELPASHHHDMIGQVPFENENL